MVVEILSKIPYIFIFNQNIFVFKKFLYSNGLFFRIKNIYLFNQKKICSMKYFYSMIFGSQIWSSIC